MPFRQQKVLPAARTLKQFEQLLQCKFEYIVLLEVHISNLKTLEQEASRHNKKLIIHADLIQGLKTDNYAADFLCNDIEPAGIISTRSNMLMRAKAKGIIAIQRMFLLDTIALEKSYSLIETTQPDYIEMLPGVIPELIHEVHEQTGIPIINGGLIRTQTHVQEALAAGAVAVTTSDKELWELY
ncbi:glycerol-3-phosphate responsive antiterminator [Sporosarcina sp. Marseille-Q4063]|uniref:glycerol-3-phosphate responsive antiterminator n=1 Tax=Sporosarcina sp. Marseille-Q4063 TaxID=2810514 RepID=UPI001BAEB962|nr:glycerol-3-phosphate responsive antiterminator [Sporosarcina sp. Marseille-Q4063]QUW21432.1 glycerol-3-phosphate responsive antiterminator [Sporosarcina sp. Marseille-Q4063]